MHKTRIAVAAGLVAAAFTGQAIAGNVTGMVKYAGTAPAPGVTPKAVPTLALLGR